MQDQIDRIEKRCDPSELVEVRLLRKGLAQCQKTYNQDPTATAKRNWDAAREGLSAVIERLEGKYFARDEVLKNRLAVVKYLAGQGYKAKRQKVYDDARAGLLKIQPDGSVRVNDVVAYIALAGLKRVKTAEGELDDLHKKEKQLQIECLEVKRDRETFNLEKDQGAYIAREDHEVQMAALAGLMEQTVRQALRFVLEDTILMAGGSTKKLQTCLDAANRRLDESYNALVAEGEFQVIFEDAN